MVSNLITVSTTMNTKIEKMWLWQWWRQVDCECALYRLEWENVCVHTVVHSLSLCASAYAKGITVIGCKQQHRHMRDINANSNRIPNVIAYRLWSIAVNSFVVYVCICALATAMAFCQPANQPKWMSDTYAWGNIVAALKKEKNEWVFLFRVIKISMRPCASFYVHTKCCGIFLFSFKKKFSTFVSFFS